MKLFQLNYFIEVCKKGSISRAAESLYVSQPSVSNAIKELEDEFGLKLFSRQNNRMLITSDGEYFFARAQHIVTELKNLTEEMQERGGNKVLIKFAAPPMISTLLFPDVYNLIKKSFPEFNLEIIECASLKARELVASGQADAAIAIVDNIGAELLECAQLFETELMLCVNKSHALAQHQVADMQLLDAIKLVLMKEDSYQNTVLKERFFKAGVKPNIMLYSNQLNTIKNFITKSHTAAFLFREIVEHDDNIVPISIKDPIKLNIGIIWRTNSRFYSDFRNLIEIVKSYTNRFMNK